MGREEVLEGPGTIGKQRQDKIIGAFYGCVWVTTSNVLVLFLILCFEVTRDDCETLSI